MNPTAPRIAAIVLAAGRSTRMAPANKLLADWNGVSIVRRVAETALASDARPVLAVTGHQAKEITATLGGLAVTIVANPDYAAGLATSLKTGIGALPEGCDGALIVLGDMPKLTAQHLNVLISAFTPDTIIVPTNAGKRGNPVLWPAVYFPELLQLQGDTGARQLLDVHRTHVREVDVGSDAIFLDIDTPDALARARGV